MAYPRTYTEFANEELIKQKLNTLIDKGVSVPAYQEAMTVLGAKLAEKSMSRVSCDDNLLLVSTSEDADYLTTGYADYLEKHGVRHKVAVFWNHHYSLPSGESVAPIVNRFLQTGYETCTKIILLKSIISGSCVIRTNLLALFNTIQDKVLDEIFVVAPVMHNKSESSLKKEFPENIASKFTFITFAIDEEKDKQGNVLEGIGGEVYGHLGLEAQPAKIPTGYVPKLVEKYLFA